MQSKKMIILVSIATILLVAAFMPSLTLSNENNTVMSGHKEVLIVEKGRLINIGSGLFCRVIQIENGTFYVFRSMFGQGYIVKGYDQDWVPTGFEKVLTPPGRRDIDHDMAFDGKYIYHFAMLPGAGQIAKFDTDFNLVNMTVVFPAGPNETILDQNIDVIGDKVYAGTEYREDNALWRAPGRPTGTQNIAPNSEVDRAMHLRIYDKDLNLLEERDLVANIDGAVPPNQYWALGTSQLYADDYYCAVVHAPVGNYAYFDAMDTRGEGEYFTESAGARQVFVLRFDDDFNFVDSVGPLTDTDNENYWCTGSLYEDGKYFVSYTFRRPGEGSVMGPPPRPPVPGWDKNATFKDDQGNIRVGIFDSDFNELATVDVTDITVRLGDVTSAAHRSSLYKVGNKLYVTYDAPSGAFVQELILKTAWVLNYEDPSLGELGQMLVDMSLPRGISRSLEAKLNAASSALVRGRVNTALNVLDAFVNEVKAQYGKKLTPAQADQLAGYAASLMDYIKLNLMGAESELWVDRGRLITVKEINTNQNGTFCRVYKYEDKFYAFYGCGAGPLGGYYVKIYDEDWQFIGEKKIWTQAGDKDIILAGEYFYMFLQQGKIVKFDTDFNVVKTFNFTPPQDPNETRIDQSIDFVNGKIIALSEYRGNRSLWMGRPQPWSNIPPNSEVNRAAMIRVFDTDLNLLYQAYLIVNVTGAVPPNQYWGMGISAMYANGYNCLVVHAPVGNYAYFNITEYRDPIFPPSPPPPPGAQPPPPLPPPPYPEESAGARQVFVLRFDDDFNFVDSYGPLTDTDNDNHWTTGSFYGDGKYFIGYTCVRPGQGGVLGPQSPWKNATFCEDSGNIRLSIFDSNFNELTTVDITDANVVKDNVTFGYHRAFVNKIGNEVYIAYDSGGGPGHATGSFVQELILKTAWTLP